MSEYDVNYDAPDKYSLGSRVFNKLREDILNGRYNEKDELKEAAVVGVVAGGDVGGHAAEVVARRGAAHGAIEGVAAVAGGDGDGTAPCPAQGVEDVVDQGCECGHGFGRRGVVDMAHPRHGATGEFVYGEMFHYFEIRLFGYSKLFSFFCWS